MKRSSGIIVVGGGHAGIEACLAIARMGESVIMITNDKSSIGRMSCNPAIGGLAKSHLVYEIDALGGIMGEAADVSAIQYKTLNKSKGRAVWSSRAQVDKKVYSSYVRSAILTNSNISCIEDTVVDIAVDNNVINSIITKNNGTINCSKIIITAGTFLKGIIHIGNKKYNAGRIGERPSNQLAKSLLKLGLKMSRLKTGTPPRLLSSSVDWSLCDLAPGDDIPSYFSARVNHKKSNKNVPCYSVNTNVNTHKLLSKNIELSAIFSGQIKGVGPRYCPSIEDKIVRFSSRSSHQLFLEPEWVDSNQIYLNGFSTSMPKDVQLLSLKTISAFKNVELIRPGYAIEYDYIPSSQLKSTLESKIISGLYFAGQVNGTSGYEEAAAQGIMAGVNAFMSTTNSPPMILSRSEAYIGVLIDDLITKSINEPYRMFTSRAEHRLFLRPETAGFRLTEKAFNISLVSSAQAKYNKVLLEQSKLILQELKSIKVSSASKKPDDAYNCILRGDINISDLSHELISVSKLLPNILFIVETQIKYKGYVDIERKKIDLLEKMDSILIPRNMDYNLINNLSLESREKLGVVLPETLGQASRIDGVRAADISVLSFYIKHNFNVSCET